MRKSDPLLYFAFLTSLFIHLFLLNAAVEWTVKLQVFAQAPGEEFFRVTPMERPQVERREVDEALWREDLAPSPGREAEERAEDIRTLLAKKGFIALDATEAEINAAIKAMFERGEAPLEIDLEPDRQAEQNILQEIIAIDRGMFPDRVSMHKRSVVTNVPRGLAASDVIGERSVAEARRALAEVVAGAMSVDEASGTEAEERPRVTGEPDIPGIVRPTTVVSGGEVETIEVVDVVAEDVAAIRKYAPLDDLLSIEMRTYHEPGNARGFFVVSIRPKKDRTHFDIIPKDIVFVIDSSSSILQSKLRRYLAGVRAAIDGLNAGDRFSVEAFTAVTTRFSEDLVEATPRSQRLAKRFLGDLVARGRTDVYAALKGLVEARPSPIRPYILFLITDGRPTAGIVENRRLINKVAEINRNKAAIYAFAGGADINEYLLDLLAYRNRGASRFERRFDRIEESLYAFYEEVREPILINLRYSLGTIDPTEVFPKVLPDFFLKSQLLVTGRFEKEAEFAMQLVGDVNGVTKELIFRQEFPAEDTGDESVARLWAFQKIYSLIGKMVEEGESSDLIGEIRRLGARYKVKSPYYE